MNLENFFLRFDWFDRQEDAEKCAYRMALMLDNLSAGHPDLSKWYRGLAAEPLETSPAGRRRLIDIFEEGAMRNAYRVQAPGYGYSFFAHNDSIDSRVCTIELFPGFWKEAPRKDGRSSLSLKLPVSKTGRVALLSTSVLLPALDSIIDAWEPDYGLLGSSEINSHFFDIERGNDTLGPGPAGNWIIYLSTSFASLVSPPPDVRVEPLPGLGIFWIADDQPCSIANPEQLRRCTEVHNALEPIRAYLRRWVLEPPGRDPRVDLARPAP